MLRPRSKPNSPASTMDSTTLLPLRGSCTTASCTATPGVRAWWRPAAREAAEKAAAPPREGRSAAASALLPHPSRPVSATRTTSSAVGRSKSPRLRPALARASACARGAAAAAVAIAHGARPVRRRARAREVRRGQYSPRSARPTPAGGRAGGRAGAPPSPVRACGAARAPRRSYQAVLTSKSSNGTKKNCKRRRSHVRSNPRGNYVGFAIRGCCGFGFSINEFVSAKTDHTRGWGVRG